MKVAVTGCEGFIGRNLCRKIERMGHELIAIDSDYMDYKHWREIIRRQIKDANFVFHVGAIADTLETDANRMMTYNYECTKVISEFCQYSKIPLVYSSSAACYGDGDRPSNLYGWSKYLGEQEVTRCGGISLRYFNVYGFNESTKSKMSSMAYHGFTAKMAGERIRLYKGKPQRDFVYVDDVISANVYAMNNYDLIEHRPYDVGTGKPRLFEDVMDLVGVEYYYDSSMSESEFLPPKGYQWYTCANPIDWMEGWYPEYSLESGLLSYSEIMDRIYEKHD